jgi:ferredoxin
VAAIYLFQPDCHELRRKNPAVLKAYLRAFAGVLNGGLAGTRTLDQRLKRALLYRLSYQPTPWNLPQLSANVAGKLLHARPSCKRRENSLFRDCSIISEPGSGKFFRLFSLCPARKMRRSPYFGVACRGASSLMASFTFTAAEKVAENVPGAFFVMDNCIDCDLCRQSAPQIFKRHSVGNTGYSFVWAQPANERAEQLAREAMQACPVEAIGQNW